MTINERIESALSSVVSNIWALSCPIEQAPDEYIVYNPEAERVEVYADDEDIGWIDDMQIHYFVKNHGKSKKPVNYLRKKDQICNSLRAAEFLLNDISVFFEKESGYTHVVFSVSTEHER